ncbi:hypothetical protein A0J61_10989 [Choanephora cucurbitarum]|nr:hypothetical protein A0J61_10989 [Choanephora cucurbitarum]
MSSPHLQRPPVMAPRQHRHSIQGIPHQHQDKITSPSPPLSPSKQSSHSANLMANSMLNLSLSPSSSSTSSSSCIQPSISTPTSSLANPSRSTNDSWKAEWSQSPPIPSLMDQLSNCTFVATAMDYTTVHYPIYPISATSVPKSTSSTQ